MASRIMDLMANLLLPLMAVTPRQPQLEEPILSSNNSMVLLMANQLQVNKKSIYKYCKIQLRKMSLIQTFH